MSELSPQCKQILDLLTRAEWIDAWHLGQISLSFTRRIHEIRQAGYTVELREKWIGKKRRTAYHLVRPVEPKQPEAQAEARMGE